MSISSIRSASEKKGCQILLIVLGALLGLGMIFTSFQFNQDQNQREQQQIAFTIEGESFTFTQVEEAARTFAQNSQSQMGFALDRTIPMADFQSIAGGLTQIINQRVLRQIATENNITLSDQDLLDSVRDQIEASVTQYKLQLQLTQEMSPEEAEEAFTEEVGKSAQQFVADQMTQIEEDIQVPEQRKQMELAVLSQAVQEKFIEQVSFSEEDLKKSYDTYTFEEVAFDSSTLPLDDLRAEAEKAREELVSGADPEAVRKKYTPNSTRKETEYTYDMMEGNPSFEPLLSLEPGEVSEVLDPLGFPAVFKLKEVTNELPEGFEENKENIIQGRRQQLASEAFTKEVNDKSKALNIDWNDNGLEMIWKIRTALTDPEVGQGDALQAKMQELYDEATSLPDEGTSPQYQALASFILADNILMVSDPANNDDAVSRWQDAVNNVLVYYDSVPFRLALYEQFNREEMVDEAYMHLSEAASANIGNYEAEGQGFYARMVSTVETARAANTFTEEQFTRLDELLKEWQEGKAEYDEFQSELLAPSDTQEGSEGDTAGTTGATTGTTTGGDTEDASGITPAPEGE